MRYAILFDVPGDRDTIVELMKAAKIKTFSVEVVEDSIVAEYGRLMEQMKDVIEPVRKHKRDLERAERAFAQDPSPRLATAIKQLKAAIRREERKV